MTKIRMIPYEPEHLDLFEQTDFDREAYGEMKSDTPNPMADYGESFTLIIDGRVMVVGGIMAQSAHTGRCWTMFSAYAQGHAISLLRNVKAQMENMMQTMGLHRIETANLAHAEHHHKWCRLLGFKNEGLMLQYDDKKRDYIRFAKVME